MFHASRIGVLLGVALLVGCGGTPEVRNDPGSGATGGSGAEGGSSGKGSGGSAGSGIAGGVPIGGTAGTGGGSSGGAGGKGSDPCRNVECDEGQRCEVNDEDEAECVDNSCDDLECDDDELCVTVPSGGHVCIDKCRSDAACDESQFCDLETGECVDDTCVPDTHTCGADDTVRVCDSNGSPREPIACESGGYYASECSSNDAGSGACTCEDDWDCPEFMVCDAGRCTGTGVEPSCTLPATPFSEVLPALEFRWGGERHEYSNTSSDNANDDAIGKAFPWSAQVVSVPLVINLDDDNGDGKADERDFPEILFISHHENQRDGDGIVRAIHGGGPEKGEDFFALCGNPARPATPSGAYSDANGAYWSDRLDATVACDDDDPCASGTTCRRGRCVPEVLTDCSTSSGSENSSTALARSSSALAAGDLDGDGFPEIVVALETKGFQILNNRGEVLFMSPPFVFEPEVDTDGGELFYVAPAPAIANLDFAGMPEIIVGNRVISLRKDENGAFAIDKLYVGEAARGTQDQVDRPGGAEDFVTGPTVCVADLTADPGLEIVAGLSAYRLPEDTDGCGTVEMPCPLELVWDARPSVTPPDGSCAIADVLPACTSQDECAENPPGPDAPLDGKPEVVLIADGHLIILDAATGTLLLDDNLGGGVAGGAPNIDDFDGDGFPEIATALSDFYQVIDLQAPEPTNCPAWDAALDDRSPPPQSNPARTPGGSCSEDSDCDAPGTTCNELAGRCVCLHNGWKRDSEDDSSKVTSSSVFDFNGDGAAEVVYGDECYFRVYDGATGGVYLALPSVSRTITENPVVADVDNDGNAEIVFIANNWVEQCDEADGSDNNWDPGDVLRDWPDGTVDIDSLPSGITVLGDPTDTWVAARRVWNQHAYHVTNVLESGGIPQHEPESWKPLNGRLYNTYRSQPRNYGVAPDLALTAIQISSPDAQCGELSDRIEITVVVKNQGDLRVGPGVEIEFYGTWDGDEERLADSAGDPIVVVLDKSLEPGGSTLVTVTYEVGNNDAPNDEALPDSVRVTIDGGNDSDDSVERECNEDNNEIEGDVDAGDDLPDLAAVVDSALCSGDVTVTVTNTGSDDATDIVVRVYAGDPSAGGEVLGDATIEGPLAPGESETITIDVGGQSRNLTVWAVADPDDTITECNDANNVAQGPSLACSDEPH